MKISFEGKSLTVAQWSQRSGLSEALIRYRINKLGWPTDRALTEPVPTMPAVTIPANKRVRVPLPPLLKAPQKIRGLKIRFLKAETIKIPETEKHR
jgi:hypothetical protein